MKRLDYLILRMSSRSHYLTCLQHYLHSSSQGKVCQRSDDPTNLRVEEAGRPLVIIIGFLASLRPVYKAGKIPGVLGATGLNGLCSL